MYKEAKDPKEEDFIRAYVLAEAAAGPYKDLLSFDINNISQLYSQYAYLFFNHIEEDCLYI